MTINNNNIFGLFTLNEARGSRLTGDWLHTDTIANYGWFGGGATVERIDFSNDSSTASPRGSFSVERYDLAATGNSNYGWFGSGSPGPLSSVDRIDFSNDSSTASPRGSLSQARYRPTATGNSNYGWFGGGIGPISTVDRIDFSNDSSTASPRGPLSLVRSNLAATGNSNYGWFGGGSIPTPGAISTVDRIDFSNDSSTASPRGPLSLARIWLASTGNSNYGWFGSGYAPGSIFYSTVDRIDFSNDNATASIRGPLSSVRYFLAATGNSNYGWFGGGETLPSSPVPIATIVSTVDRIDFSNDNATASIRGPLSSPRYGMAATSGVLNIRRQKAGNYGWFGGGQNPGATVSTVDRIDFSNDLALISTRGSLPTTTSFSAATGNSNYGWFGGGYNPAGTPVVLSRVTRINFSNDLTSTLDRGSLNSSEGRKSATGNSNYGWFGGGLPGSTSTVDRIDFSNDLATASPRGPLSSARYNLAATGNSNYGWFGGGKITTPVSTVQRIDFSNDSIASSPRGVLVIAVRGLAATGNSNYGWFGGGYVVPGSTGKRSTVSRINFSNDLATASPRGPLSSARYGIGATGNSNYGWFGGGSNYFSPSTPSQYYSSVDRIDFSNDSPTVSPRGPLSSARYGIGATSNTPIG